MGERFSFSNALKAIQVKESFMPIRLESKLLKLGKQKKKKATGGFLIPVEFSRRITLGIMINDAKITGRISRKYLLELIKDWESATEACVNYSKQISKLEKSLKWYKQRHKQKRK